MTSLQTAAPARALAVTRRHRRDGAEDGALLVPPAVEREVVRAPAGRGRRREVDAPEHRALVAQLVAGDGGRRTTAPTGLPRIPRNRVTESDDTPAALQSDRIGVEQVLVVVRATPELPRHVVERLVERDRPRQRPAQRRVRVLLSERARDRVGPLRLRRVEIQAHAARDEVRAGPRAQRELRAAEAAARDVVGRRHERARDRGVPGKPEPAEVHPVERGVVLVRAKAKYREAIGIAVGAGHRLHAGQRRGHRREVAHEIRRNVGRGDRPLGTADVGCGVGPRHLVARSPDVHLAEHGVDLRQLGVGDEDLLIGHPLDLEAFGCVADRRERHHVVAVAGGERHGEAAVAIRSCGPADVAGEGRHGHEYFGDWQAVRPDHATADDVGLLRKCAMGREARCPRAIRPRAVSEDEGHGNPFDLRRREVAGCRVARVSGRLDSRGREWVYYRRQFAGRMATQRTARSQSSRASPASGASTYTSPILVATSPANVQPCIQHYCRVQDPACRGMPCWIPKRVPYTPQ